MLTLSGNIQGTAPDMSLSYIPAALGNISDAAGNEPAPGSAAVEDGLVPRVLHSAITGPNTAVVGYSEPVWALSHAYGPVYTGSDTARNASLLSGNGTAEHTISFAGTPAPAGVVGSIMISTDFVWDKAVPFPNILVPWDGNKTLADGQAPAVLSAAVTGPNSATILYDKSVAAADVWQAYYSLSVGGAGRNITGLEGLNSSAEHVLVFDGPPAGTGATGSVVIDPAHVSNGSANRLGGGGEPFVQRLADAQRPEINSAAVTGPITVTVTYSEPALAAQSAYRGLAIDNATRPIAGMSGSGSAEHVIAFGGARAAADSTGDITINASAVLDGAESPQNALGDSHSLGVRLADGSAPHVASASVTGPNTAVVRYSEPAAAYDGAYSGLAAGGAARNITGSEGLGGSAEHVLVFDGPPAAANDTGLVTIDRTLVADSSSNLLGTGAPFTLNMSDGQAPSVLLAVVTGAGKVAVQYSEPAWASESAYLWVDAGSAARRNATLESGSGTDRHVIAFRRRAGPGRRQRDAGDKRDRGLGQGAARVEHARRRPAVRAALLRRPAPPAAGDRLGRRHRPEQRHHTVRQGGLGRAGGAAARLLGPVGRRRRPQHYGIGGPRRLCRARPRIRRPSGRRERHGVG